MYQYIRAIAKERGKRTRWKETFLYQTLFSEIYDKYSEVIFTLTNTFLSGTRYATLKDLQSVGVRMDMTPEQWFSWLGNKAVPDTTDVPEINETTVTYRDGWRAGYKVHHIAPAGTPNPSLPLADRPNLLLQRDATSYADMYSKCLVTINGLFHMTDYNSNGLHVIDGGKSMQYANKNLFGLVNFDEVGAIAPTAITPGIVSKGLDDEIPYAKAAYVNTGVDLTGKSVMLSLGGYLHINDDVYQIVNREQGIIKVTLHKLNLMHRIFESRKLISLASLSLPSYAMNPDLISTEDLFSDDVILSYLTLPQSFVVVVDAPNLYVERHPLESAKLPGVYYTGRDPVLPLELPTGLMAEYWVRQEDDQWILTVEEGLKRNYLFETTDWRESGFVQSSLEPDRPYEYARNYLLEIGCERIIWTPQ